VRKGSRVSEYFHAEFHGKFGVDERLTIEDRVQTLGVMQGVCPTNADATILDEADIYQPTALVVRGCVHLHERLIVAFDAW
jgi:hypothetical protein